MSEGREPGSAPRRGPEDGGSDEHARDAGAAAGATPGARPAASTGADDGTAADVTGSPSTKPASTQPPSTQPPANGDRLAPPAAGADERRRDDASDHPPTQPASRRGAAPPPVKRRGGFLALLALLIACAALAAIGWPYWMLYQGQDPLALIASDRLAAYETRIAELERSVTDAQRAERAAQSAAEDAALAARRAGEATAAVGALRDAFADLSASAADAAPLDDRQWRLAEAAYLLRVANLRARMENDRDGARSLLEAADILIADLDDYGLFPVREEIAEALTALRSQPVADRVGLYLELEQLGDQVAALPLDLPEYRQPAAPVTEDAAWYETLGARTRGLFEFRADRSEPVRPLLPPDEALWLRHNLQLQLEQAQLALLRGHEAVWTDSLEKARRWVQEYFDADDPQAAALTIALTRLIGERIDVPAPDISGPLTTLQQLRGRGIPEAAP